MTNTFEEMLTGGHPNSLGNTVAVVDIVLKDKNKLQDLYRCYFSDDEVVRLRISSAFKRVCKVHPEWLVPYVDRFVSEVSRINQPSAQWTFAQLMMMLDNHLSDDQRQRVVTILRQNLEKSDDWIVLNFTMEALATHAKQSDRLKVWLTAHLRKLAKDPRKSVANRATKFQEELS